MRGTIALGTVKGARYWTQPVRAPATVQRCPTQYLARDQGGAVVFLLYWNVYFCFLGRSEP